MAATANGLVIAAPASGNGKTTLTLGLLKHLSARGLRVSSAKVGPDYIDPQFHRRVTGRDSVNLDAWGMRPETLRANLAAATDDAELVIVEGAMGLYDGANDETASTAHVAALLQLPVILVVDASAMAQSAAAIVHGFATYRGDCRLAGVVFNRVGGPGHRDKLVRAVERLGIPVLGCLPRMTNPEAMGHRHLGLVQPEELDQFDAILAERERLVASHVAIDRLLDLASPCSAIQTPSSFRMLPQAKRIAVADDVAFRFSYPHVRRRWREDGVEWLPFSPLADESPEARADTIYLPGGYPELYAERLAGNQAFLEGLRRAADRRVGIYGECGGFMVLGSSLQSAEGRWFPMADLLPLRTSFAKPRLHLGYRRVTLASDGLLGEVKPTAGLLGEVKPTAGLLGEVKPTAGLLGEFGQGFRAHEFHYASIVEQGEATPLWQAWNADGTPLGPMGLRRGNVCGSFLHLIDQE
ncbi:Cobyrinic acid A,C-diamide synthase [Planctomycetes bacterium Pan216]|uniref:Cobyrinate a,c-diamide synthase n=1 Tax=Kolteria novifilia TaxID=2527975 RepID=A0A518BBT6_9BACT|nr:Cobyrinic acid A,C-diamide synthase [Planctomycetes bacterium Pan216]